MIGRRVLDAYAFVLLHAAALYTLLRQFQTAVEEPIVLMMPSTAVAAAWAELADDYRPVLEVQLRLPVAVIDNLDKARARAVGQLGAPA